MKSIYCLIAFFSTFGSVCSFGDSMNPIPELEAITGQVIIGESESGEPCELHVRGLLDAYEVELIHPTKETRKSETLSTYQAPGADQTVFIYRDSDRLRIRECESRPCLFGRKFNLTLAYKNDQLASVKAVNNLSYGARNDCSIKGGYCPEIPKIERSCFF